MLAVVPAAAVSDGWAALAAATYPAGADDPRAAAAAQSEWAMPWAAASPIGSQIAQMVSARSQPATIEPRGLPAVAGAMRLIASTIDQLVLSTSDAEPAPRWLARPRAYGSDLDQGDLVQWLVTSMAGWGHGSCRVVRSGTSWRMDALHPSSVRVLSTTTGMVRREWLVDGTPTQRVPGNPADVVDGRAYLLHIPYFITPDHPQGVSPLQLARTSLEGFAATEQYALRYTDPDTGNHSGGRLSTDQDITPATAEHYQNRWIENRRTGRIPVLGSGLTYDNDLVDPATAQWIEARAFNQASVYMMFGIPPAYMGASLVGGQSSMSYANQQDNDRVFRRNCIEAFTTQIEDALTELLGRPGRSADELVRVQFDWSKWEVAHPTAAATPTPGAAP